MRRGQRSISFFAFIPAEGEVVGIVQRWKNVFELHSILPYSILIWMFTSALSLQLFSSLLLLLLLLLTCYLVSKVTSTYYLLR